MSNVFPRSARRGGLLAICIAGLVATTGYAAEDEIIVTGSRIVRPDIQSASPLATVDNEEIKLSGAINAEEFLNELPQAVPGTFSSTTNNGSDGSSSVQLRGLGEERTLVLVNGRRFIPKDQTGVADINAIPVALIERTEVITGGASAVYGSDALAGVVNFILKDDFEGVQFDGQFAQADEGDGDTLDMTVTFGGNFADDRGNITAYLGYTKRDPIFNGDRRWSRDALQSTYDDDDNVIPGVLVPGGSVNARPTNILLADPAFDLDGDGIVTVGPDGGLVDGTSIFNFQGVNYLQVPQERHLLGALGHLELNEHAEVYTRIGFSNNDVSTQLAPLAVFLQDTYFVNLDDNPFLSPAERAALVTEAAGFMDGDNTYVGIGRRLSELGGRITQYERTAWQGQLGLRGNITGNWDYDAFFQRSQTNLQETYLNDGIISRIQQALLVVDDGDGPECIDPSNGCVPLNVWSAADGSVTPEALDFIRARLSATNRTRETIYGISATGDLGDVRSPLAGSPIGVAVGYEYRDVTADYRPDQNLATGNSAGFGAQSPVEGEFYVHELFAEINLPLIEDRPGIHSLSAEAGYRFSNYSSAADTTNTYKFGMAYAPIERLKFRGMYQRAVRAPNIDELFSPSTESAESAGDPCAGNSATVPLAVQALCEGTGVPAGFYGGGGTVTAPPAGQIQGFIGGNPDLVEESSDTYTIGFVAQPLDNLTLAVDYYDIDIEDAIDAFGGSAAAALQNCYDPGINVGLDPDSPFCQVIKRNPANGALFGTGFGVDLLNQNLSSRTTSGVDFTTDWQVEPGFIPGDLRFNLTATWVDSFAFRADPTTPERECAGAWGLTCLFPIPEWRASLRTTWSLDQWQVSMRLRSTDSVNYDLVQFGGESDTAVTKIASQTYVDLSVIYDLNDSVQFQVGADNLLDNEPPLLDQDFAAPSNNGNGNTFPALYDSLGIWLYAGATVKF